MLRVLQSDLLQSERFIVTLELVPGRESFGQSVDTLKGIAADAFADGRISAVSITDNPGGNPSLSPDAIGHEVFRVGMDVIVHFACRDMNRSGMESRALQLAMMGIKNILAVSGDYTGKGFGGRGTPVFDLDSVSLLIMLNMLSERINASGDPEGFMPGAAITPFKYTEGESFAQYAKLCKKAAAGARFAITQLGYDARKFEELIRIKRWLGLDLPVLGSVYLLGPKAARAMNRGVVPGAVVTDKLLKKVLAEWKDPRHGLATAVERSARLAAILKGLGYRGIHIGGIHRSFDTVRRILDRMEVIKNDWREFLEEFNFKPDDGFYAFSKDTADGDFPPRFGRHTHRLPLPDRVHFHLMQMVHRWFFDLQSSTAPFLEKLCQAMDNHRYGRSAAYWMEGIPKTLFLDCRKCGDCAIQHVGFLCPESKCPKHIRNGACGGSRNGNCEVYQDRKCVWYRAYQRWASADRLEEMVSGCVPPRMWELDHTPSWLNFHLERDHQSASNKIAQVCRMVPCKYPLDFKR